MNDKYSDEELKKKYGLRNLGKAAIPLFSPAELGYRCPKGHANITWSEFNEHIWCYVCKKDFHYAKDCILIECEFNPKNLPQQPRIITGIINVFPNRGEGFNDIPKEVLNKMNESKINFLAMKKDMIDSLRFSPDQYACKLRLYTSIIHRLLFLLEDVKLIPYKPCYIQWEFFRKRNVDIFKMYFGLTKTKKPISLQKIGNHFGITRERVRQIKIKVRKRTIHYLYYDPEFREIFDQVMKNIRKQLQSSSVFRDKYLKGIL